jgi:hypothetical protein
MIHSGIRSITMGRWPGRLVLVAAIAAALPFAASGSRAQGPRAECETTVEGTVRSMTSAPLGEIDGATLEDGTVIHWPRHLADRFTRAIARGERIRAACAIETGPAGDMHLEVLYAANLRTGAEVQSDSAIPPAGIGGVIPLPEIEADFAAPRNRVGDVERRLKALEDQVAQSREEIRKLRDEL